MRANRSTTTEPPRRAVRARESGGGGRAPGTVEFLACCSPCCSTHGLPRVPLVRQARCDACGRTTTVHLTFRATVPLRAAG